MGILTNRDLRYDFCAMILDKEGIDLSEYVELYDNFLENHWEKRFSDFCFVRKIEVQKQQKINSLQKQLDIAMEALSEYEDIGLIYDGAVDYVLTAKEAKRKIEAMYSFLIDMKEGE